MKRSVALAAVASLAVAVAGRGPDGRPARAAAPPPAVWPVLEARHGGVPGGVVGAGRRAWVASGAAVLTVDLAADPPAVVGVEVVDDVVGDLAVRGDGARLAAVVGGDVVVWRIDDAGRLERREALDARPQLRSYGGGPGRMARDGGRQLAWWGQQLVVAMCDDGDDGVALRLGMADEGGDGAPRWRDAVERAQIDPFLGGSLTDLAIAGDRAALAVALGKHGATVHGVDVFDLPTAGPPVDRGTWPAPDTLAALAATHDDQLAVLGMRPSPDGATREPYVGLLDLAGPTALGDLALPTPPVLTAPTALAAGPDGRLYVGLSGRQPRLVAVSTADGAGPRLAGDWPTATSTLALTVVDGAVLRRDGGALWRFAAASPAQPTGDGALVPILGGVSDVAVDGGQVYAAAADSPWPLYRAAAGAGAAFAPLAAADGRLPVADVAARVVDRLVPQELAVGGDRLWLLDARSSRALWSVDRAQPGAPVLRRRGDAEGWLLAAVGDGVWQANERQLIAQRDGGGDALTEVDRLSRGQGTFAALAARPGGAVALAAGSDVFSRELEVYDAAPDGRIVARGRVGVPGLEGDRVKPSVTVSGTLAYVAWQALSVIDLADPDRPALRSTLPVGAPTTCIDVAVEGALAVAACGELGWALFDLRDPQALRFVRRYDTPGYARRVALDGDWVYIADLAGGLAVVRLAAWDAVGRRVFLPVGMR